MSTAPYTALEPLPARDFRAVWLETVFEHHKTDPQIGDTPVLSDFVLRLSAQAWVELQTLAERLAAEALQAERELLQRPELHALLGIPAEIRRLWRDPARRQPGTPRDARIIRFDFHHTAQGWRISEANIDTPGGLIEAEGFSQAMLAHYPGLRPAGQPARALARAIRRGLPEGAQVALLHATAYADDRGMMLFLQDRLQAEGLRCCLLNPAQLRWQDGLAELAVSWQQGPADCLLRFFPAEWLPNLPEGKWQPYFADCRVPASNPTPALLAQSKRFPLAWDRLETRLPTWRACLPETVQPGKAQRLPKNSRAEDSPEWVYKPIFGRAGEGIGMPGLGSPRAWRDTVQKAQRWPAHWIAQRRFQTTPLRHAEQDLYPCIGVYTVDGKAAGIYGRIAANPLIDEHARDIAVGIEAEGRSDEPDRII